MAESKQIGILAPIQTESIQDALQQVQAAFARYHVACLKLDERKPLKPQLQGVDMLLCLGGDGTMLSVAADLAQAGIPLAGINLGRLGFLTACSVQEIDRFVDLYMQGSCVIEARPMLRAQIVSAEGVLRDKPRFAVNEIALMKAQSGKMVDLDAYVNGDLLNRYHADGILVVAPSGSTAYSLSAGGPLIWPQAEVLCITPICPHSLTSRAVVLPNKVKVSLRPRERRGRSDAMIYSLDGRHTYEIKIDEHLEIELSDLPLKMIQLPEHDFSALLRSKLRWQGFELPEEDDDFEH